MAARSRYASSSFTGRSDQDAPSVDIPVSASPTLSVRGSGDSVRSIRKKTASPGFTRPTKGDIIIRSEVDPNGGREVVTTRTIISSPIQAKRHSIEGISKDEAVAAIQAIEARRAAIAASSSSARIPPRPRAPVEEEEDAELLRVQEESFRSFQQEEIRRGLEQEAQLRRRQEAQLEAQHLKELEAAQIEDAKRLATIRELERQEEAARRRARAKPFPVPKLIPVDARVPNTDMYSVALRYPSSHVPVPYVFDKREPMRHVFELARSHTQNPNPITLLQPGAAPLLEGQFSDTPASKLIPIDEALAGATRVLFTVKQREV